MIAATTLTRLWWGIGFLLVAAAVLVCLVPQYEVPRVFEFNDKLSHAGGHALLAVWFAGLMLRRAWWKIIVALVVLGIAIESAQYLMQVGRHADARDVVANSCGALLGLLLARLGLSNWPDWAARLLGQRRAVP